MLIVPVPMRAWSKKNTALGEIAQLYLPFQPLFASLSESFKVSEIAIASTKRCIAFSFQLRSCTKEAKVSLDQKAAFVSRYIPGSNTVDTNL